MSIQDLGNLGEFIASIGVIVTLIYLTAQLRQNTGALRETVRESASQGSQRLILARAENVTLATVIVKADAGEDLDPVDVYRLEQYGWASMRMLESIFKNYESGLFDVDDWNGYREVIRYWMSRGYFFNSWKASKSFFRKSFVDEVEEIIKDTNASDA